MTKIHCLPDTDDMNQSPNSVDCKHYERILKFRLVEGGPKYDRQGEQVTLKEMP